MLDDFREQADTSTIYEDEANEALEIDQKPRPFLGMTPVQRFVIALMLLVIACVLSAFCLIVTEKIFLPFIYCMTYPRLAFCGNLLSLR